MSDALSFKATLEVGGNSCASSCGGAGDRSIKSISFGCDQLYFQTIVETADPIRIATIGAVGDQFVDLGLLQQLGAIEFLYLRSNTPVMLRVGAAPAVVVGVGATYPTGFVGGETLTMTIDGISVSVTFTSGAQTAAQVCDQINAACALVGLPTPRSAVVAGSGQVSVFGIATGSQGSVVITGGSGAADLGLTGLSALGRGEDIVTSMFINLFTRAGNVPPPPARIQISGNAQITILAAGLSAT